MKVFQEFKAFAISLFQKFLKLICPNHKKGNQNNGSARQRRRTIKRRGRSFNFQSFLAQNYSKEYSRDENKKKKIRKARIIRKAHSKKQYDNSEQPEPQRPYFKKSEILINQIVGPMEIQIKEGEIFTDQNGLELSSIEFKGSDRSKNSINEETDSQLLKFTLGNEARRGISAPQKQFVNIMDRVFVRKLWWIQAVQSEENQLNNPEIDNDQQSLQQESQRESCKSKTKTKKIKHKQNKKKIDKQKIKVIRMMDLVENEDEPKLLEVPLSKCLLYC